MVKTIDDMINECKREERELKIMLNDTQRKIENMKQKEHEITERLESVLETKKYYEIVKEGMEI